MKTIEYDGRKFWQVTDRSAIRHHKQDRLEVLNISETGEILYKSRTVMPRMYDTVKAILKQEGIV